MIKLIQYKDLGHADYGWLNARHHFSFASYQNPERVNFGSLRVINDDIIAAGTGFATHPHDNMEIITYVRKGAITHKDSNGNEGRTEAGDVQVMSAGTGIYHSEHNHENVDTILYQIWIEPNQRNVKPRWDSHEFPKHKGELQLLVAGDGRAPLAIHADALIYAGNLKAQSSVLQSIKHQAYILVSEGCIEIDGVKVRKGDGAEITRQSELKFNVLEDSEVLVLDVATAR